MKILIPNFKGNQTATLTVKGQYKRWDKNDIPAFMCINSLDSQLYDVFNHHTSKITVSKKGCIGTLKTSDFSIVK